MAETIPIHASDRTTAAPQSSMTDLVSGIITDAKTLIGQQASMLRAEIKEDFRRTGEVAKFMSVGAVLTAIGGLYLVVTLPLLLNHYVHEIPLWACWAIFAGLFLVAGAAAIIAGKRILNTYNPLPDKTANALEENLTWKTTNRPS